jgi:hypothetical protein
MRTVMEAQLWVKLQDEERWADILVLRGQEVYRLTVIADIKGLRHKLAPALEALQSGQDPQSLKADRVKSLNAQTITKADVSPDNEKLTLYYGENGSKKLIHSTGDNNAGAILQEILAQSGKTFQPVEVEIGASEALAGPVVVGVMAMAVVALIYANAGRMAAGQEVEVEGRNRIAGFLRSLKWMAQLLGPIGTIAVGAVVLILIVAWAVRSVTHRPKRTVWLPAQS